MPATWVLVAIAAMLLAHLVFVAAAIRNRGEYAVQQFGDVGESVDVEAGGHGDGTVRCRHCGANNDAEYRYCRQCVSELPGGVSLVTGDTDGGSRRTT